jgi:hypothetical protein
MRISAIGRLYVYYGANCAEIIFMYKYNRNRTYYRVEVVS